MNIPSKSDAELKQLAIDLFAGRIFTDRQVLNCDSSMVFMVLALMSPDAIAELRADPPGLIYEYLSEAGPRSVNGLPTFFSMRVLNREDTEKVFAICATIEAAIEAL